MSKERIKLYRLDAGLNTTTAEQSGFPGVYTVVQNVRLAQGPAMVRKGMKRLAVIPNDSTATIYDFDGTNDTVTANVILDPLAEVWPLPGTRWTVEFICQADTLSADSYILANSSSSTVYGLRIKQTSSNTIVATVQDSAAAVTTLTSAASFGTGVVVAGQIVRDGASLTMRLNNATEVTGTMDATNICRTQNPSFGSQNGANYYDGRIEWVRGFNVAKSNMNDCWTRLNNPRAPDVLFDYVMEPDAGTGYVLDRSRYENHGDIAGSPTTTSTLLGNPPMMVQSMAGVVSKSGGTRKLVVTAHGISYTGSY